MKLYYHKTFLKDLADIPSNERKRIEDFVFNDIKNHSSFRNIPGVEKLKGFKHFYKIRFGNYRVGISYSNDHLTFERVMHRKEIYRYFP